MQLSYVELHDELKHGGRPNLLLARSRNNLRSGFMIIGLGAGIAATLTVVTGRVTFYVPMLVLWGFVLVVRGWRQRTEGQALRQRLRV